LRVSTIGLTRFFAALGMTGAFLAGCDSAPRSMAPVDTWGPEISEASHRFNVPEPWIRAVMAQESGGRTHWSDGTPIVSHAGAMGLMQVMPGTWDELAERYGLGDDPNNPRDNIMAGTAYIREMYEMYGNPGFLGAYNAGPGRYGQYVSQGRQLPTETVRYMEIIGPQIAGIYPDGSGSPLMDQYAEAQVRRAVTPATVRMDPIPDGSTGAPLVAGVTTMAPIVNPEDQLAEARPVVTPATVARATPVGGITTMAPIVNPEDQLAEYTTAVGGSTATAPVPVTVLPAPAPAATGGGTDTAAILSAMANDAPTAVVPVPAPAPRVVAAAVPPVTIPAPAIDPTAPGSNGLPPGWFVPTAPVSP
jgi:hypothetical protein